jgi:hypothetical protein
MLVCARLSACACVLVLERVCTCACVRMYVRVRADCLKANFQSESIPDYFCSKCSKNRAAVKTSTISGNPDVLIVHVVRGRSLGCARGVRLCVRVRVCASV